MFNVYFNIIKYYKGYVFQKNRKKEEEKLLHYTYTTFNFILCYIKLYHTQKKILYYNVCLCKNDDNIISNKILGTLQYDMKEVNE